MITTFLFDFSRVLLHPKDPTYTESIDELYEKTGKENFFSYFVLNDELFDFLTKIRDSRQLALFSDAKILFDPLIQKRIKKLFAYIFSAKELGISKKDKNSYLSIAASLHATPEEILFIDDTKENLEHAKKAGLQTVHYTSNEKLLEKLNNLL